MTTDEMSKLSEELAGFSKYGPISDPQMNFQKPCFGVTIHK